MSGPKIDLFNTVKSIHEKGVTTLTASELDIIEKETRDLLRSARGRVLSSKAPKGFSELLDNLKNSENDPDSAYKLVLDFMKGSGDIEDKKEDKSKEDKPKEEKPKEDKKEDKPKDSDPLKDDKDSIIDKVEKISVKDLDEEDMDKLKEGNDEESLSMTSMGIKGAMTDLRARVTPDRNIMITKDGIPVMFHTTAENIKKNDNAVKRQANMLLSWTMNEGIKVAAQKSGSKIIGGVDDDISVNVREDFPGAPDSVLDGSEDLIKDELEKPGETVNEDADFDFKEKVSRAVRRARIQRRRKALSAKTRAKRSIRRPFRSTSSVLEQAEDNIYEDLEEPSNNVQEGSETDYQRVEADMRTLYNNRTKQEVDKKVAAFIDKFVRSVRIASTRMQLNHDDHLFKAAVFDVLTDSDLVESIDDGLAAEISEEVSSKAHDGFVNQLLDRASDLIKKDDKYLKDVEDDLKKQKVRDKGPEKSRDKDKDKEDDKEKDFVKDKKDMSVKSSRLYKQAREGNFGNYRPSRSINTVDSGLSSVMGQTKLGTQAMRLASVVKR
jgi:hypothetical protein